MFKINDIVIHKSAGACVIFNIIKQNFGNGEKDYYYLIPKFTSNSNKSLEIYLPIEKESTMLRHPLDRKTVISIINSIPNMSPIWIADAKTRKLKFEEIYHQGDIHKLCALVKFLYITSPEDNPKNKKMSYTDKDFLNKVKLNIFEEFAVALEIFPEQVETYIENCLNIKH